MTNCRRTERRPTTITTMSRTSRALNVAEAARIHGKGLCPANIAMEKAMNGGNDHLPATPRVNAVCFTVPGIADETYDSEPVVDADVARTLERELIAAQARLAELERVLITLAHGAFLIRHEQILLAMPNGCDHSSTPPCSPPLPVKERNVDDIERQHAAKRDSLMTWDEVQDELIWDDYDLNGPEIQPLKPERIADFILRFPHFAERLTWFGQHWNSLDGEISQEMIDAVEVSEEELDRGARFAKWTMRFYDKLRNVEAEHADLLTQQAARIAELERDAARMNKVMHLASQDIVFFGGFLYDPSSREYECPDLCVLCNDFFEPAADCETFTLAEVDEIYRWFQQFSEAGVLAWVASKREWAKPWRLRPANKVHGDFALACAALLNEGGKANG